MTALVLSVRTGTPPNMIDEVIEDLLVASSIILLFLMSDVRPQEGDASKDARTWSAPRMSGF